MSENNAQPICYNGRTLWREGEFVFFQFDRKEAVTLFAPDSTIFVFETGHRFIEWNVEHWRLKDTVLSCDLGALGLKDVYVLATTLDIRLDLTGSLFI